jgi:hypothetical protein
MATKMPFTSLVGPVTIRESFLARTVRHWLPVTACLRFLKFLTDLFTNCNEFTGFADKTMRGWDLPTQKQLHVFEGIV